MDLHVSLRPGEEIVAQLYAQVRAAIIDERLRPGDAVPPTRELAAELGVSRGSVTSAYDRLVAEGFLEGRVGAGTFVAALAGHVGPAPGSRRGAVRPRRVAGGPVPGAVWRGASPSERMPLTVAYNLSLGVPDPALFPLQTWRRLVSHQMRRPRLGVDTYDGIGHPRLQAEIARHVGLARSVVAATDDVVVTAGAQQALDLVARVLVEPGTVVAVEDPGYAAAHRLFATHRAVVRGVPVDDEGLVVAALPARARVVYVTPSHQFPTGVAMSLSRRSALLQWAVEHDAVVIEDDYDSEFRFADRPLDPLQSLDRHGRVVYVGSFSKSLLPALRIGYLVAPPPLTPALREALRVTVWNGDVVTQGALADFIADGHHAAHVRKATKVYRRRREVLLDLLDRHLADRLEVVPSAAGLHVCTLLRDEGDSDVRLAEAALAAGVLVDTLSSRRVSQPVRQGLALGFGAIEVDDLPDSVARLDHALR